MRLFLSSQDLGKYPEEAFKLVSKNHRVAFIKNAQDDKPPKERNFSLPDKKLMFEQAGFEFQEIDLRKYFGKTHKLREKLKGFGLVWCSGGNTFILRRAMVASGFDEIIKDRLSEDSIVYGGSSAGSCVAARSLRGIDKGDRPHPDVVPEDYPNKEMIWDGLGLVPFMVIPHYGSTWFQKEADATVVALKKLKLPYKILKDGQVIVIEGNKEKFLK